MFNSNEQLNQFTNAFLRQGLGTVQKDQMKEAFIQSTTPTKVQLETIEVEFQPSYLVDEYVDSWFGQMDRVFRANLSGVRPKLKVTYETPEWLDSAEWKHSPDAIRIEKGKVAMPEREAFTRYLETIFWRKMAAVNGNYGRGRYTELRKEVDYCCQAPALFANAVTQIGSVQVINLALQLEPIFASDYRWQHRLLTPHQFRVVADWVKELSTWGFQSYNGFNARRDGNLDFMLLVVAESFAKKAIDIDLPEDIEESDKAIMTTGEGRACKFTLASQKVVNNVMVLYRYFFYNKKIEYITDSRLTYSYSSFDEAVDLTKYIVEQMVYQNNVPSYLDEQSKGDSKQPAAAPGVDVSEVTSQS